jgi:hypothetical protein
MSTGPYLLDHSSNESIRAMNRLASKGHELSWLREAITHDGVSYPPGAIMISGGANLNADVEALALDLGLLFTAAPDQISGGRYQLKPPRLGMYKRYAGGNMDEGWTNWLLKDFEFSFTSLFNKDMRDATLPGKYDVIIIPDDSPQRIIEGADGEDIPQEFRGGIGKEGVENIKTFVKNGGTLITLNGSYLFARQLFELPVEDTLTNVSTKEFYNPGSTLKISVDTTHPLGYGMPQNALALFRRSPSLRVSSGDFADRVKIAARYHEQNLLQSGWLIGESFLSMKPAIIEFQVENGKVILLAFPAQHRAQTHGTFKFLFNAIYYGPAELVN